MFREFTEFQWAMLRLDAALTQTCDIEHVAHTVSACHFRTPEAWIDRGGEWYLSDGGYSRVVYGEDGKLFLTSNSTDKAKARWKNEPTVQGLVTYVERLMREAYDRLLSRGGA